MAVFTAAASSRANDRLQSFKLLRLSVAHPKARLQLVTWPGVTAGAPVPVAGRPCLQTFKFGGDPFNEGREAPARASWQCPGAACFGWTLVLVAFALLVARLGLSRLR
jgi:hypothetical protein